MSCAVYHQGVKADTFVGDVPAKITKSCKYKIGKPTYIVDPLIAFNYGIVFTKPAPVVVAAACDIFKIIVINCFNVGRNSVCFPTSLFFDRFKSLGNILWGNVFT